MLFVLLVFFILLAPDAHAYLDPGTGSMILQAIVGGFIAVTFVVKTYWRRLKAFFLKKKDTI